MFWYRCFKIITVIIQISGLFIVDLLTYLFIVAYLSPGLDHVPVYWLEKLPALHSRLAVQFQNIIDNLQCLPAWLVSGKTNLILKVAENSPIASNYHPITCLPTLWKLLSGIIAYKMLEHLTANKILAFEQTEIWP